MSDALRDQMIELGKKYFAEVYDPKQKEFIPGKTYIPPSGKLLDAEDLSMLLHSSLDLWLTAGRFSNEFEAELPKFFENKLKALLVNSGSSANLLAFSSLFSPMLKKMGLRPLEAGDEIICAAAGFPTTVNPAFQYGCIPVFIDVNLDTLNVLPEAIENAITSKTRAVMIAHTLGNPFRSDLVAEICKKHNLFFIEDCCDALGAKVQGKSVGSFGEYATLSFYPAHHITMGEGGAVLGKSVQFQKIAESVRDWGRDCYCEPGKDNTCNKRFCWKLGDLPEGYDHKYTYSNIGYNLKVTDMQAAIGISQLKKARQFIEMRNSNYQKLFDAITGSAKISKSFKPAIPTEHTTPSWFGFALHCRESVNRNQVVQKLEELKVGTRLLFAGNLTKQPAYRGKNFRISGELTNTDAIMNGTFWIGLHPKITDKHIEYMLEQLENCVE